MKNKDYRPPKNIKNNIVINIGILIVCILLSLSSGCNSNEVTIESSKSEEIETKIQINTEDKSTDPEIKYTKIVEKIGNLNQSINIIEFFPSPQIKIFPVLSYNSVFGFGLLSEMISGLDSFGAINGGFHSVYGRPNGMIAVDGEFYTNSNGGFPAFISNDNKYYIDEPKIDFWFNINNQKISIKKINDFGDEGDIILYTPRFGSTNRANRKNLTIIVVNNYIKSIVESEESVPIPADGFLISIFGQSDIIQKEKENIINKKLEVHSNSTFEGDFQVYECGSWLVRNGEIVAPDRDSYVGTLLNRDPRTAIGIKYDGKVVLITADGRQPGIAVGFTAKEFAAFLKGYGIKDAAMLDGGASTEMIVDNKLVNNPSYLGRERPLASGVCIKMLK